MSESLGYASGSLKMTDLNASIEEKQRKELCVILQELKDRDTELNEMVKSHKEQIRAWELDRKRASFFENKCQKMQHELNKKQSELNGYLADLKLSETKNNSKDLALQTSQMQLKSTEEELSTSLEMEQSYQEKIETLESSLREAKTCLRQSSKLEQDMKQQIINDREVLSKARSRITDLEKNIENTKLELKECLRSESCLKRQIQEQQKLCDKLKSDLEESRENVTAKSKSLISCHEKIVQAKDHIQKLHQDVEFYEDQLRRKDDLIMLQRSKQQRNDIEVNNLRKLFEEQQHDIVALYNEIKLQSNSSSANECSKGDNNVKDERKERIWSHYENESLFKKMKAAGDNQDRLPSFELQKLNVAEVLVNLSQRSLSFAEHLAERDCDSVDFDSVEEILPSSDDERSKKFPSPTTRLQQILNESREMVDKLEKTAKSPVKLIQENI